MNLRMISMLMIASVMSLFFTACDDDDEDENKKAVCPTASYNGDLVITAFGVTLEPTDWSVSITDGNEKSLTLVAGEFNVVVPMPGGKTIERTIKTYKLENVGYELNDGFIKFLPGEFVTTDGVFETIKVNIVSGSIDSSTQDMLLDLTVQPEGMPMPMALAFTTKAVE